MAETEMADTNIADTKMADIKMTDTKITDIKMTVIDLINSSWIYRFRSKFWFHSRIQIGLKIGVQIFSVGQEVDRCNRNPFWNHFIHSNAH